MYAAVSTIYNTTIDNNQASDDGGGMLIQRINKMFKYCVWYVLKESHPIQQSVMKYADLFHSAQFRAHITIGHSMDEEEAYMILKRYRNFEKPCFTPIKKPFASSVNILNHNRSGECVFNAIEQPLAVNGVEVEDVLIVLVNHSHRWKLHT